MNDLQTQMNQSVQEFVVQITDLARRAALDTLGSVFVNHPGRANGTLAARPAAAAALAALAPSPPVRAVARPGRGGGVKRAPEDIEALAQKFASFVKSHPGLRIEQINKELGTTTKDLALPIRKLLSEGRIGAKGQKRATQYFPGRKAK